MRTVGRLVTSLMLAVLVLSGCTDGGGVKNPVKAVAPKDPLTIETNVDNGASSVPVDTLVTVDGFDGQLSDVSLATQDGKTKVPGDVRGVRWTAQQFLEPGTSYVLTAAGTGDDGKKVTSTTRFTTKALSLDEQTYPAVAPLQGETVGVGMPVIVSFDLPVKDRAAFEKRMKVTAQPATVGGWYWLSDNTAHWRPKSYWKPGTKVSVDLALNSVPAGDGIYGQQDQRVDFTVGRSVVSIVDTKRHRMTVKIDGKARRTIPVSTGDASHRSRNGTKLVMEKHESIDMDAATTGVDSDDPNYYNLKGVKYALRVTNSGEFLHAAPWSAASQGNANVSHGCVGMSTANAGWLFSQSKRGDVVRYVGSPRRLEPANGWTDWNVSWSDWLEGSALQGEDPAA
ncbi:L,D-transpeptidase [Aeromicrobium duanguangcaii]|uniref:L,D-transpeptidase n=1 Tax=Aeromicrobium duanguangcaii TaxID=2968086 RepID=UPI002017E6EB|nr:Ig-like domain-containing protein [Aeromicrobium duanguangcaii]MCL3836717.1 Ig-like domain-containing protein [Aeromicrobium duanguangcaii]